MTDVDLVTYIEVSAKELLEYEKQINDIKKKRYDRLNEMYIYINDTLESNKDITGNVRTLLLNFKDALTEILSQYESFNVDLQ